MIRIPLPTPETADIVAKTEMIAIKMICVIVPGSIPNSTFNPAAIAVSLLAGMKGKDWEKKLKVTNYVHADDAVDVINSNTDVTE